MCVCLCASIKEKRHRRQSNAGDLFFTAFASVSVCVSARLCARALVFVCVDHQRAAVKTPERQGSAHPPQRCSDTQNNAHTPPQKKPLPRQWENIMPLPAAHNPGNPGAERYPIPAPRSPLTSPSRSPVGSFRVRPAARQLRPPTRPTAPYTYTLLPSRLLTRTGAPQRLKGVFASQIHPEVGSACVGYISISRGTVQRGPSFHSFTTSPPPLTGMKAAIPSPLTGVHEARGALPTLPSPRRLFIFSCSHCPHVNAVNHTLLSEFLSENEERGNNARLNKHFGN